MAEPHLFICHIWPKHFKFILFIPSLGVRSLRSNAFLNQCTNAFLNMIIVGSLVQAHNQSTSLLHPLFVQSREMSLESGYISHEGGGSSRSTPSSPKKFAHFLQTKKRHSRAQLSQSASEDDGTTSPTIVTKSRILENPQQHFTIREKRQKFQK